MGGIYGCGCKEVYRFPHITYPFSAPFCSIPTFYSFKKMFSFLLWYFLVIYVIIVSRIINTYTGYIQRASHGSHMKGCT